MKIFNNSCRFWLATAAVFSMTARDAPAQNITALYSFTYGIDGATPYGGLIQASNGVLYGTAINVGTNNKYGTIFKITTNGVFTPLFTFTGASTDGSTPYAGLLQGANGNFYGDSYTSGSNGYGSVFKLTSSGAFSELYGFTSLHYHAATGTVTNVEGANPIAPLVAGTNGNFYGTTSTGGSNGYGAVFEITGSGALTKLHSFTNGPDGAFPGALLQNSNGLIYGTTANGGTNGYESPRGQLMIL